MKFQDDISMPHTHTHTQTRTSRNQFVPHFFKVGGIKSNAGKICIPWYNAEKKGLGKLLGEVS